MTPATVTDHGDRRGVMAWNFDLPSQETRVIKHGYKVSWPQPVKLGLNGE